MFKASGLFCFCLLIYSSKASADHVQCEHVLEVLANKVEDNYAGYADNNRENLNVVRSQLSERMSGQPHSNCLEFLSQWLSSFSDPSLNISFIPAHADEFAIPDHASHNDEPQLTWLSSTVALLDLPSFETELATSIKQLISDNYTALESAQGLIVDLRGNNDGSFSPMYSVLELIGANGFQSMWHVLASADNTQYYRRQLTDDLRIQSPSVFDSVTELVASMSAYPNTWVEYSWPKVGGGENLADLKEIFIIQNHSVGFSGEEFILAAKHNHKVKTFGSKTLGQLDYAEPVPHTILDSYIVYIPSQKRVWLQQSPINNIGLVPDVKLHVAEEEVVEYLHDLMRLKLKIPSVTPNI
ncbi:hypothetical protein EGH82_18425 [Vibrio ponticus]|uniref:Tail specific protease domain-containing protein n=1 Tax=Vibrio ponticus TaxID=265668 RepID=A0A3N3DVD1_9VIBR|nr:S41 family peptidase [Vibrio ponticus]ROV58455.1 hypothetical protein EGH82_18425 [Vibrio ponticus]